MPRTCWHGIEPRSVQYLRGSGRNECRGRYANYHCSCSESCADARPRTVAAVARRLVVIPYLEQSLGGGRCLSYPVRQRSRQCSHVSPVSLNSSSASGPRKYGTSGGWLPVPCTRVQPFDRMHAL